jgi:membrane-bound lytic murein transglycosylase D
MARCLTWKAAQKDGLRFTTLNNRKAIMKIKKLTLIIALTAICAQNIYSQEIPQNSTQTQTQVQTSPAAQTQDLEIYQDVSTVFQKPAKQDLPLIQENSNSSMPPLDNKIMEAISLALEKSKGDKKTFETIMQANESYKNMREAFMSNNQKDAKKYFSQFMKAINSVNVEPALLFFFFDDFENILSKLNNLYETQNLEVSDSSGSLGSSANSIDLNLTDEALIEKYIKTFTTGRAKETIKAAIARSGAYSDIVDAALKKFNLPPELKYLPVIESHYLVGPISRAGAAGLWQIMPSRGRALGLQVNYWVDERFDPEKATEAAALYLKQLYLMLNDWHLVLAAYNRGEYGLVRDMKYSNASDITEMVKRNAIPRETQNYVPQFIAIVRIMKDPQKYGFDDVKYQEPIKYDKVKMDKIIDLKIAAECAQTTQEEIKRLNPSLKTWRTPHGYPNFELKIPYGTKQIFLENIAAVKDLNPSTGFIKYKVQKGDYLGKIAGMFKTTENAISNDNPIIKKSKYLQPGMVLTIRPGKGYFDD